MGRENVFISYFHLAIYITKLLAIIYILGQSFEREMKQYKLIFIS